MYYVKYFTMHYPLHSHNSSNEVGIVFWLNFTDKETEVLTD